MRRMVSAMVMLAMLAGCGLAEAAFEYWTGREDIYFHADSACGTPAYGRVAVSREAAEMFDRKPCPVCVTSTEAVVVDEPDVVEEPVEQADPSGEITAAERSGTWVLRIPKATLEALLYGEGALPEGVDAMVSLYGRTLTEVLEAQVMLPADGSMLMNLRVIDGDVFAVTRPAKRYKSKRPYRWVAAYIITDVFDPGAYSLNGVTQAFSYIPANVVRSSGRSKRFSKKYGDLQISVDRVMKTNVAVIHIRGAMASERLTGMVAIGDASPGIPVAGYVDDKKSVFCLVLTDGELDALKSGAKPAYTPQTELTVASAVPDLSGDELELG